MRPVVVVGQQPRVADPLHFGEGREDVRLEHVFAYKRFATSPAQCACILVASPRLFEPECTTLRQMQLPNPLCRYIELAQAPPEAETARPRLLTAADL